MVILFLVTEKLNLQNIDRLEAELFELETIEFNFKMVSLDVLGTR